MAAESPGTEFHAVDTGAYRYVCVWVWVWVRCVPRGGSYESPLFSAIGKMYN